MLNDRQLIITNILQMVDLHSIIFDVTLKLIKVVHLYLADTAFIILKIFHENTSNLRKYS